MSPAHARNTTKIIAMTHSMWSPAAIFIKFMVLCSQLLCSFFCDAVNAGLTTTKSHLQSTYWRSGRLQNHRRRGGWTSAVTLRAMLSLQELTTGAHTVSSSWCCARPVCGCKCRFHDPGTRVDHAKILLVRTPYPTRGTTDVCTRLHKKITQRFHHTANTRAAHLGVATRDRGQPVLSNGYVDALEHLGTAMGDPDLDVQVPNGSLHVDAGEISTETVGPRSAAIRGSLRMAAGQCHLELTSWPQLWGNMQADALDKRTASCLCGLGLASPHPTKLVDEAADGAPVPPKRELVPRQREGRCARGRRPWMNDDTTRGTEAAADLHAGIGRKLFPCAASWTSQGRIF